MATHAASVFSIGEPAPWFRCASSFNESFFFAVAAGRYTVLSFLGDPQSDAARNMSSFAMANKAKFDDRNFAFFGVVNRRAPELNAPQGYGIRYFWDEVGDVARLYGVTEPTTFILDSMLRVRAVLSLSDPAAHQRDVTGILSKLPPLGTADEAAHAPVLILPRILETDLCRHLISLYHKHGGEESGYMRQVDGRTVPVLNSGFKRRKDFRFDTQDEFSQLRSEINKRITRRLVPEITKAFQYTPTILERYIVAHYSSTDQGFFNAHRDNTTSGTAPRRFACTINLNAEEYEGGDLRFPEFGPRTYRAPTGGAVVFSCSLLHEATPVTKGERYAFLPFFYDHESAKIREENLSLLDTDYKHEN